MQGKGTTISLEGREAVSPETSSEGREEFKGHTPGPWEAVTLDDGSFEIGKAFADGQRGWDSVICARNRWRAMADQSNANARLIAAAPDLLRENTELCASLTEAQAELATLRAEHERLKAWRNDVTSALLRPGGAHYADVPRHIREMWSTLADMMRDWEQLAGDGVDVNPPDFIVSARRILGSGGAQ